MNKEENPEVNTVPTEETVQKTLNAAELSKERIQKRLEALENTQKEILKTLVEHGKKIVECSIQR